MDRSTAASGLLLGLMMLWGCRPDAAPSETALTDDGQASPSVPGVGVVEPRKISQAVDEDSDDPAIWLHPEDPSKSLVLGTDKGGGIFVFDLDGMERTELTVRGLGRTNNIDIEYGVLLAGKAVDLAMATDRDGGVVHAFRLPDMLRLSPAEGLPVFVGETGERAKPMGIALYKRARDGAVFAVLSRKSGPADGYLWQYRLIDGVDGGVGLEKVRAFGAFSGGEGEIEAVVVDDALGFVYYSDEWYGVRKYHADPDAAQAETELAVFGRERFTDDREGLSIYIPKPGAADDGTGYLVVSDQQAARFRLFPRQGSAEDPHRHDEIGSVAVRALESDGSELSAALHGEAYPGGLFVAMSDDKTFHFYAWNDLWAGLTPPAVPPAASAAR